MIPDSIIIVDDEFDLVESFSDYFGLRGYNVVGTGYNGLDAVNLYKKYRPDVVLMDISMPKYDGIYGLVNIKKIDSNAKIILITGNDIYSVAEKIKSFNLVKLLQKPCSPSKLEKILKSVSSVNIHT